MEPGIVNLAGEREHFVLRSYQDEMLEESIQRNCVVVLDTGAGKTHIAIARTRVELESHDLGKIVWFLAPTVTLCEQHARAFEMYLPEYQVRKMTGEDEVERWTDQQTWDDALSNMNIVISTPAVLLEALSHAFVTMERLSLCIFDEAHHCTKKHPTNQIMQFFYSPARRVGRKVPHILGLSASPVLNTKQGGLGLLETNLNSTVVTPKLRRLELMQYVHIPQLVKRTYDPELLPRPSPLLDVLRRYVTEYDIEQDPYIEYLRTRDDEDSLDQLRLARYRRSTYCFKQLNSLLIRADAMLEQVGPGGVEWLVTSCSSKLMHEVQQDDTARLPDLSRSEQRYLARALYSICKANELAAPLSDGLSKKVQLLLDVLVAEAAPHFTGIVFAEQRTVVAALFQVVQSHPSTSGLFSPGRFVGSSENIRRSTNIADVVEVRGQQQTLEDFRVGKKNLIISTSVLEEGIDIPSCQTVICFDPPRNLVSFVQRRGRARKQGAKYIILMADNDSKGNPSKWQYLEDEMKVAYMDDLRNAERASELERIQERADRRYVVEESGAVLTLDSAKAHVYHFCSTLHTSSYCDLRPVFRCTEESGPDGDVLVTAVVTLPISVHPSVRTARSAHAWRTETMAIKDAAFEAYVALHKHGLVNDHLLPLRKDMEVGPSAMLEVGSFVMTAPRLTFSSLQATREEDWSQTNVTIDMNGVRQGLQIFLPVKCPSMPNVTLHWTAHVDFVCHFDGLESAQGVECLSGDSAACARSQMLDLLTEVMPAKCIDAGRTDFAVIVFMPNVPAAENVQKTTTAFLSKEQSVDVFDRGIVKIKGQQRLWIPQYMEGKDSKEGSDEKEQYLQLSRFPKKRDLLRTPDAISTSRGDVSTYEVALRHCELLPLSVRTATVAACIPSLLYHIETLAVAHELQRTLLQPVGLRSLDLILEATTSSATSSTNYERLEYLGDSVLKFITHVQLMTQHPTWPEGYLTAEKGRTNGNASLAHAALRVGLSRFINTQRFSEKHWRPPYSFDATGEDAEDEVQMSAKTLADVVEALIGASFIETGLEGALDCIKVFLPAEQWVLPAQNAQTLASTVPPPQSTTASQTTNLLQDLIGRRFSNTTLVREATTHASFTSPSIDLTLSYERLEFVGDAVLDQLIVPALFAHRTPRPLKNHEMHDIRQALANAHILGFFAMSLAVSVERNDIIKTHTPTAGNGVTENGEESSFTARSAPQTLHLPDFLRCSPALSRTRSEALTRLALYGPRISAALSHGTEYPWPDLLALRPPKMFSDMIESVLGALFVDSGGDVEGVCKAFFERCGLGDLLRRVLGEGVETGFPKARLGVRADRRSVGYRSVRYWTGAVGETAVHEGGGGEGDAGSGEAGDGAAFWRCTVVIADEDVVTVEGCETREEAEVRAAVQAVGLLDAARGCVEKQAGERKRRSEGDDGEDNGAEGGGVGEDGVEDEDEEKGVDVDDADNVNDENGTGSMNDGDADVAGNVHMSGTE